MTEEELKEAIQDLGWEDMMQIWQDRRNPELQKKWGKGKFFEYAIIHAFEPEKQDEERGWKGKPEEIVRRVSENIDAILKDETVGKIIGFAKS